MLYTLLALVGAAGPDGHYFGTKNVMGYNVKVDMKTGDAGFFSLSVVGGPSGDLHCDKEAYTLNGNELSLPNADTAGDCAHDQLKAAKLGFKGATYDPAEDTVTVHAKYLFVSVTVECKKAALELPAPVALLAAGPDGHYFGTKNVLGFNVKVDMKTGDAGFFSVSVTGGPSGDVICPKEAYTLNGNVLTMPNADTAGDCAHDQLKAAKLTFKSATYDAAEDTITMNAKYLFISVTVVAKKAADLEDKVSCRLACNDRHTGCLNRGTDPNKCMDLADKCLDSCNKAQLSANDCYCEGAWRDCGSCPHASTDLGLAPVALLAAGPDGHYFGTKNVLGFNVKVDMKTGDAGFFSVSVTGGPSGDVVCPKEAYTLNGNVLSLPNADTAGDCAHDQLKAAKLTFKSATYDPAQDTVTMNAKYLFISVTVVAKKAALELPAPVALLAAGPDGHYFGTKNVMGYNVKVDMKTGDAGVFSLSVTGGPSGDVVCAKEAYTLNGDELTLPNAGTAGDCAHDQLKAAKLTFKGATYDAAKDTVTVHAKYLFVSVTVECSKVSSDLEDSLPSLERILNRMN